MTESPLTVIAQPALDAAPEPASMSVVIGAGLLAVLGLLLWSVTGYLITAAHEGGHALFGSAFGSAVLEVRIRRNSGHTAFSPVKPLGPIGDFVTSLMGYLGPPLFGLVGAVLLDDGQVRATLFMTLFFLVLLLTQVNDLGSLLVVLAGGGLTALGLRSADGMQTLVAYTWVWFLLAGGVISVRQLARARGEARARKRRDDSSDAYQLSRATYLPAALWVGILWLVNFAALVFGAAILLQVVGQQALAAR